MSYIDDLNQAASEALAASSSATDSAQIMFDVANGGETTTVTTANGEVKTLAKAIKDIIDAIEAGVEAPQVEPQTLSAGQTTVTLSTMTAEGIAVYVEGSREFDFTIVNSTDFEFGQSFPDGTRIWVVKRDIEGVADSFTVNTSTGSQTLKQSLDNRVVYVNTIADLKALDTAELVDGQVVTIASTGRAGDFVVRVGDFSTEVASDAQQGVWAAFDDDPTGGALVAQRVYVGPLHAVWFGALEDGVSDDTDALQAAQDMLPTAGVVVSGTSIASSLTVKADTLGGGVIKRLSGSTGDFISTGADGITIDVEIDEADTAGSALVIQHNAVTVSKQCVVRNASLNGIKHTLGDDVRIHASIYNCKQAHIQVIANTADILGLDIDAYVNGESLGAANLNGGIKVHGSASWAVVQPRIRGKVVLAENASMPANAVCVETLINVPQPNIDVDVLGGSIGVTMNASPGGVARASAKGQHNTQLEIANGSHGAGFYGSSATAGSTVSPLYNCQSSGSDDLTFDGTFEGATTASVYLDSGQGALLTGNMSKSGGTQLIRLRLFSDISINLGVAKGSSTQRAITWDASGGAVSGLYILGGIFSGIANFMDSSPAGTYSAVRIAGGARIKNTGLFMPGNATDIKIEKSCSVDLLPTASGVEDVGFISYVIGGAPIIEAWGTGTPEGFVTADVGSVFYRKDGGASTTIYIKESGTGSTGWVAK